jgi:hypothetical protein
MSTPPTKRDQRRESRRQQYLQQQSERRRVREAAIRRQRLVRYGLSVAAVVVLGLLIWGAFAWYSVAHAPTHHPSPARGDVAIVEQSAADPSHALAQAAGSPGEFYALYQPNWGGIVQIESPVTSLLAA